MFNHFHVLIVGAGNIGAFYDKPQDVNILTHAHAFTTHSGFTLAGFVDHDILKAEAAARVWGGKAYGSVAEAFQRAQVDIVCVAVQDEWHYNVLKEVALYPVKLVFAEKPLTKTLVQAEEVIALYKQKKISVLVNYTRRFVPEFEELRKKIKDEEFGRLLCGTGYYGKGLLHNGSHMIDFLHYLLGTKPEGRVISVLYDQDMDDPSITALLDFQGEAAFVLHAVDCRCHTIFELDLLFERKRLRVIDAGFQVEEYNLKNHEVFTGYRTLVKSDEYATQLGAALKYSVENIFDHLTQSKPLRCTAEDAFAAMDLCIRLYEETI